MSSYISHSTVYCILEDLTAAMWAAHVARWAVAPRQEIELLRPEIVSLSVVVAPPASSVFQVLPLDASCFSAAVRTGPDVYKKSRRQKH